MAHLEYQRKRVSGEYVGISEKVASTIELWGPINQLVQPPKELIVRITPSNNIQLEKLDPIKDSRRAYRITAAQPQLIKLQALNNQEIWDFIVLDIEPKTYMNLTAEKIEFIRQLFKEGGPVARKENFPVSAMLACACAESGYGTSSIYKKTGNPFNLQKPDSWAYPKCTTLTNKTENKLNEKAKPAPFCTASSLAEATRQWCEWIRYFPNKTSVSNILAYRNNPMRFAEELYRVGFADSKRERTKEYASLLKRYAFERYDQF